MHSIISRFLEQTREYRLHNAGEPGLFRADADGRERRLFQRLGSAFPILDRRARTRILGGVAIYPAANTQA